jgi:hypothetical protein
MAEAGMVPVCVARVSMPLAGDVTSQYMNLAHLVPTERTEHFQHRRDTFYILAGPAVQSNGLRAFALLVFSWPLPPP